MPKETPGDFPPAAETGSPIEHPQSPDVAAYWLKAVVESADDAIITKTLEGVITSWNPGAQRIFGYTAEETVGQPVTMLIPEEHLDEEPGILARIRAGERIEHYETVRVRKDGSLVDISLTVSPIRKPDGTIIGASKIARDITARKRAEAELREQAEVIDTVNRLGQTLSGELDLHRLVQAVTDAATELTGAHFGSFFYNVLNEDGGSYMLYTMSGVPLEAFAHFPMPRATDLFGPTFRGEGTILVADVREDKRYGKNSPYYGMPEGHLPVVSYLAVPVISRLGDPVRLQQVIWNLLSNAIKFTPKGGRVQVRMERVNSHVEIAVSDTGQGIEPGFLPHVFDRFRQADGTTTRHRRPERDA